MHHTYVGGFSKLYVNIFVLLLNNVIIIIYIYISTNHITITIQNLDLPRFSYPCAMRATTRHLTCQATNTWWSTTSPSFVDAQNRVDQTYADKAKWCKLSIQVPCPGGWGKLLQKGGHGEPFGKWSKHATDVENPAVFENDLHSCRFSTYFCMFTGP